MTKRNVTAKRVSLCLLFAILLTMAYSAEDIASAKSSASQQEKVMTKEQKGWLDKGRELDGKSANLFFQGKYSDAILPLKESTNFYIKALGPDNRWVGDNYSHIGTMYFKLSDKANAEKYYKMSIDVFKRCGGSCQAGEAITNYCSLLRGSGRDKEAAKLEAEMSKACPK